MCDSSESFSKVACSGEYCFNNTQWKKQNSEPKQKLLNLIRLRKVTLGQCARYCFVNNYPKLSSAQQQPFLGSQFYSLWIRHRAAGFSAQGLPGLWIRGLQGTIPPWRLLVGQIPAEGLSLSSYGCCNSLLCAPLHVQTGRDPLSPPRASDVSAWPPFYGPGTLDRAHWDTYPCFKVIAAERANAQVPGLGRAMGRGVLEFCLPQGAVGGIRSWKGGPQEPCYPMEKNSPGLLNLRAFGMNYRHSFSS